MLKSLERTYYYDFCFHCQMQKTHLHKNFSLYFIGPIFIYFFPSHNWLLSKESLRKLSLIYFCTKIWEWATKDVRIRIFIHQGYDKCSRKAFVETNNGPPLTFIWTTKHSTFLILTCQTHLAYEEQSTLIIIVDPHI